MTGPGYRPAPGVAHVVEAGPNGPVVYVAPLPGGPISVLEGSAGAIWCAATSGPAAEVAETVAEAAGVEATTVAGAVAAFLDELVAGGLLVVVPAGP